MGSCLSRSQVVAPNKVLPKFDEEKDYLGKRGYSKTLKNRDGVELFAYFWPANPDVPLKGVIQLAHGSTAYTCFDYLNFKDPGLPNVYDGSWVESFNQAGFSVCGIDHQGYGRSKGARPVKKFQAHVDNLLLLSDELLAGGGAAFPKEAPYFLVGHSMGGLAAILACLRQPKRFAGLVLVSPLLQLESGTLPRRNSRLRLGEKFRPKSDDGSGSMTSERPVPWLFEAWAADPYVRDGGGGGRSSGTQQQRDQEEQLLLLAATRLLSTEEGGGGGGGGLEGLVLPLLVFQSERDTCTDPLGVQQLYERAASSDKTFRRLSQQWHVLTKEEGWEGLLQEATSWLVAHATNSGALTRGWADAPSPPPPAPAAASTGQSRGKDEKETAEEEEEEEEAEEQREGEAEVAAPAGAEAEAADAATDGGGDVKAERSSAPLFTRSMSMLERMPEHEPLNVPAGTSSAAAALGPAAPSPPLPARRYSFGSLMMMRPIAAPGDTTPTPSSVNLLMAPLPPLRPVGQRRTLGAMPVDLASYNVRGRLPPLPPLLDRKPVD